MGAWIEISVESKSCMNVSRRTPRWVRGLKSFGYMIVTENGNVAPHDGCVD